MRINLTAAIGSIAIVIGFFACQALMIWCYLETIRAPLP